MTDTPPSKPKFTRADAMAVAKELCDALKPHTGRLVVAGSLRRRKELVGDVEILYVPKVRLLNVPTGDMFEPSRKEQHNEADAMINTLVLMKKLRERENVRGSTTWGGKNKLALHVASGIPVDLFSTTHEAWWNYLVCRTGGVGSNARIAALARDKGWHWDPYGVGFWCESGLGREWKKMESERDVFAFVGLPYEEPWERP